MPVRVLIDDTVLYEGESVPVPKTGELIVRGDESLPVESVTWDFREGGLVVATLRVGDRPYTY